MLLKNIRKKNRSSKMIRFCEYKSPDEINNFVIFDGVIFPDGRWGRADYNYFKKITKPITPLDVIKLKKAGYNFD